MILKSLITVEYKSYKVSKAYKVIFKRYLTQLTVPFYKIHLNLIPRIVVAYFLNKIMQINKVEIIAKKLSLTQIVIKYCNVIKQ